jgi:hypothetical protein
MLRKILMVHHSPEPIHSLSAFSELPEKHDLAFKSSEVLAFGNLRNSSRNVCTLSPSFNARTKKAHFRLEVIGKCPRHQATSEILEL